MGGRLGFKDPKASENTALLQVENGLKASLPVLLGASGDDSSTTRSAISPAHVTLTDSAAQQALTGKTAQETLADLNRDTASAAGQLSNDFNREQIEAGFAITQRFSSELNTFINHRATEAERAQTVLDDPNASQEAKTQADQDKLDASAGAPERAVNIPC